jgi:hypothetical protein
VLRPFRQQDYFSCRIMLALMCAFARRAFGNSELLKLLHVARQAKPVACGSLFSECGSGFRELRFIWPNRFISVRGVSAYTRVIADVAIFPVRRRRTKYADMRR